MPTQPAILGTARLGNVRLGYLSAALVTARAVRFARVQVVIGGVAGARVRVSGLLIRDALNDAPGTCAFTVEGTAPQLGQTVRVTLNDGARVLFAGSIQTVELTYEGGDPSLLTWACTAIDDTARLNARRPFGTWTLVSATTIATEIVETFAPDFSVAGIAADLPPVSLTLDGSETVIAALARLATAIGGYAKVDDSTAFLFLEDLIDPPAPLTAGYPFLNDPPLTLGTEVSQLRTRCYGKGYGENVPTDVAAGETIIPITDGVQFTATGGLAIAGTTPDGAQSERIAYTGVALSAGGTLVGPGAAPANAPTLALAAGAGVTTGSHDVAVVFVTALGRSAPGPVATLAVGFVPPPVTAPTAGTPTAGTGPDYGSHQYALTELTAAGETTPSPLSSAITTAPTAAPSYTPGLSQVVSGAGHNQWAIGASVYTQVTHVTAVGETTGSPSSATVVQTAESPVLNPGYAATLLNHSLTLPSDPAVTSRRLYFNVNGAWVGYFVLNPSDTYSYFGFGGAPTLTAGSPPGVSTAARNVVPLTGLPLPSPLGTGRKLYGTAAGAAQLKYIATLNTTDTTYGVTTPDASLGANAPTANTATANQIAATAALGPTGVTSREFYMSPAGGVARKLAATIPNNTGTTATITASDATLAAALAEPTGDTSGLTQPAGQVNAGSTTLLLANPPTSTAGWMQLSGGQFVRYTGVTGNTITGIPATGPGAIITTVLYGSQALPAPALVGVTGLTKAMLKGSAVHIWVQEDALAAQAAEALRTDPTGLLGHTGIVEYLITDARRAEPSLRARCVAALALFAYPIRTARYATRDVRSKSGKTIVIQTGSPLINEVLTIQDVTITEIDVAPGVLPRFTVTASSVRWSLEDLLRRLVA